MKRSALLIAVLAVSCSKNAPAPSAAATTAEAAAPKPVSAQLPDVIARVNGETISKSEFESALQDLEKRAGRAVPAEDRDRVYRDVLDQLVGYRLLQQEAHARKIAVPDPELNERLEVFKQHFGSPEEFNQALAAQKMTIDQFRDQTRTEMQLTKMLEGEIDAKISVQPKDLTDFYEKNPDQFRQEERIRASHILFTVAPDADAKVKDQARTRAAAVLKQVRAGSDFARLAQKHSQDPGNAKDGGDIGYFTKGQMVGAFERAAFALKPGEVSDVVETPFGFHIIKVVDKQDAKALTLDEVRPQLEEFLKNRQRQEKTAAFVAALKNKGRIEILI